MKRIVLIVVVLGLFVFGRMASAEWTPIKRLTWNTGNSEYPAIAVDSLGYVHVAWQDDRSGDSEIYYRKSTNEGSTWLASQRLTWNSGGCYMPTIAVDSSGNVHVVWEDYTPGNDEIYYRKYLK